ncbi:hypothetical protein [Duganella guangzhouensis]|uniref:hypothetical protein n=1 Tax=Duganella guangzhouensis TaxID=2666084 RepID=UPI00280454B2|nr:hypothetical protein [Duganella guangzhouensis]
MQAADAQHTDVAKITALIVDHSEERLRIFSKALRTMWGEPSLPILIAYILSGDHHGYSTAFNTGRPGTRGRTTRLTYTDKS